MPGSPRKRVRRLRLDAFMRDPEALDGLLGRIAEGETLHGLSRTIDLPFTRIRAWLLEDPERAEKYKCGLMFRDEYLSGKVISTLRDFADLDPGRIFDAHGDILPLREIPEDVRRCITKYEVKERKNKRKGGTVRAIEIQFVDPAKVLQLLGKYLEMFK